MRCIPYILLLPSFLLQPGVNRMLAGGPPLQVSFPVRQGAEYLLESSNSVGNGAAWTTFTNFVAGDEVIAAFKITASDAEKYFRVREHSTNRLTVPLAQKNTFANASGGPFWTSIFYQLFYGAEHLKSAGLDELRINAISFRLDESQTLGIDVTIPRFQIWASTFRGASSELSPRISENWGSDRVLVFSAENVRFQAEPELTNPSSFQLTIHFQVSFPYRARGGHLLLDISVEGRGGVLQGRPGLTDAVFETVEIFKIINTADPQIVPAGEVLEIFYEPASPLLLMISRIPRSVDYLPDWKGKE